MKKFSWLVAGLAMLGMVNTASAQNCSNGNCGQPCNICAPQVLDCGGCGGCDPCGGCDSGCNRGGVIAEVGFMILSPYWDGNPAFIFEDDGDAQQFDFGYGSQFVPKLSIGAIGNNGVGARIGWWGFAISATEDSGARDPNDEFTDEDIISAGPLGNRVETDEDDESIIAFGTLRMNVWDFEAVYASRKGCWGFLTAGGIRYAHISQDYNAAEVDADDSSAGPEVEELILSGHNFNGAGPTIAFQTSRSVGGSGLALIGGVRGSLLFGTRKHTSTEVDDVDSPSPSVDDVHHVESDAIIPVTELELAVAYERNMGRGRMFLKAGINGQVWFGAGNHARNGTVWQDDNGVEDDETAAVNDNLGLLGFLLSAGMTY